MQNNTINFSLLISEVWMDQHHKLFVNIFYVLYINMIS